MRDFVINGGIGSCHIILVKDSWTLNGVGSVCYIGLSLRALSLSPTLM